ncbi:MULTISPECIES: trypsin-like serine peptidase [Actinotignum]|uniref:trypsin-like serine peptidase n=1 Tax=Actinotignum TaxID=1653174 RepID=UPI00254EC131|nr:MULTISPECIES: hypothetical protein [Actinotignum]MDK7271604.1 hypothetical protein [Actinotignum schaalii]MDY5150317.1 hypothetical protein [Actinotignum timonense]
MRNRYRHASTLAVLLGALLTLALLAGLLGGCALVKAPVLAAPVPRPVTYDNFGDDAVAIVWDDDANHRDLDAEFDDSGIVDGRVLAAAYHRGAGLPDSLNAALNEDPKVSDVGLGEGLSGAGYNFPGIPQVGTFFHVVPGTTQVIRGCTGVVLDTPGRSQILSAAHCWPGDAYAATVFVPQFSIIAGTAYIPHGIWRIDSDAVVINDAYYSDDEDADRYDAAVLTADPDRFGNLLEDVTGGLPVADVSPEQPDIEVIGYPVAESFEADNYTSAYPRHCRNSTETFTENGVDYFHIECAGMPTGVSGGPWLQQGENGEWAIVAITGGAQDGGGYTDDESVGVPMDNLIAQLLEEARITLEDATLEPGNPAHEVLGYLGGQPDRADAFTVWPSGAVALYLDAGSGAEVLPAAGEETGELAQLDAARSFRSVRLLGGRDRRLRNLRTLAAGDLDGSGMADILTLGRDGALILWHDPGLFGLRHPEHLNPHLPLEFTNVTKMSIADDTLTVTNIDGTTTQYADISQQGIQPKPRTS